MAGQYSASMHTIPVMRPMLPAAERLLPYLRQIDTARIYSNFGPLALSFEQRLATHFELPETAVVTVANATLGLALALLAQQVRPGTLCMLPAWTFIASAHAVRLAGLVPYFVDVDARTWAIDATSIEDLISQAPAQVGAVMPVVPFGQPIDLAAWDRFRASTGVPVVIDAAAGFDALVPGKSPAVVSLHATKTLGIGEGGFVVSTHEFLIKEVGTRANFGFRGRRTAAVPAMNAKLSEYHAAVGLAALDEWPQARVEWAAVARDYRRALPEFEPGPVPERIWGELGFLNLQFELCGHRRGASGTSARRCADQFAKLVGGRCACAPGDPGVPARTPPDDRTACAIHHRSAAVS